MAGTWPKAQADAKRTEILSQVAKSNHATKGLPIERLVSLSATDVELARELISTAIAAIGDSMTLAERKGWASESLLAQLAEYRSQAADLLERMGK